MKSRKRREPYLGSAGLLRVISRAAHAVIALVERRISFRPLTNQNRILDLVLVEETRRKERPLTTTAGELAGLTEDPNSPFSAPVL
jgi:hypothetical protein